MRIILSIILGFVFPFVSMMAIGAVGEYLPRVWTSIDVGDKTLPGILFAPFTIPVYMDDFLKQLLPQTFDTFWIRIIFLILFDWILYGTISYLLLGRLKRFKKQSAPASEVPPLPPTF